LEERKKKRGKRKWGKQVLFARSLLIVDEEFVIETKFALRHSAEITFQLNETFHIALKHSSWKQLHEYRNTKKSNDRRDKPS